MHSEKKVTFLISSLAGGGAEGVCVNIANGLAELGWDINLVVLHLNNAVYKDRVSSKVKLDVIGVKHARHAFFPLKKYLNKKKPSKVLVFNYELTVLMVLLRIIFRLKLNVLARNINTISVKREQAKESSFWRKNIVTPLIDFFYLKADHVINQCKAMEQDLLDVYPKLKGKTSVIYNPIAKYIEDYTKDNDVSQAGKEDFLLCVGRLENQKAFHYAIEAFSKIASKHPTMRLKIVGQGSLEKKLKQLSLDLKVANKVDFEGFQKDMTPYYLKARATVLTSLYEGFPNVLVESIALGTPVIAFDCPSGSIEIVKEGVNGYLVPISNVNQLALTISKSLTENLSYSEVISTAEAYKSKTVIAKYQEVIKQ